MRENERALRKVGRDLDREKVKLEQEEKKLVCISFYLSDYHWQ